MHIRKLPPFSPFFFLFSFAFPVERNQNIKYGGRERWSLFNRSVKGSLNTKPGTHPGLPGWAWLHRRIFSVELHGMRWQGYLFASDSAINPQQGALRTPGFRSRKDKREFAVMARSCQPWALAADRLLLSSTRWLKAGRMLHVRPSSPADCSTNILLFFFFFSNLLTYQNMGLADKSQQLHQSPLQSIRQILSNFQISTRATVRSSDLYNLSC